MILSRPEPESAPSSYSARVAIDIERTRSETPGVKHGRHLLACGSALMPTVVAKAISDHIELELRHGGYQAQAMRSAQLDSVYGSIGDLIGAEPHEIAIMENATAAWSHAFYSIKLAPGDRILTSEAEYAANYVAMLQRAKSTGAVIEAIPSDPAGMLNVDALKAMMDERVKLIAITWVPTNGGLVNPAAKIGRIAAEHNILYLLDGCQAIGQMPVDVTDLRCDFFTATGRKFLRGPRGTGFLYVRSSLIEQLEPVVIDHFAAEWTSIDQYTLRSDARRFENWENSYSLRAGLGAACEYAMQIGIDRIQKRTWGLADRLRSGLEQIAGATVRDLGSERCAIVSFTIDGQEPTSTVAELRKLGTIIGTSAPSSTRLDAERRHLPVMMRAAPHYYNTESEIDTLLEQLASPTPR